MRTPKEPATLKRQLKKLELAKRFRDLDVARHEHLMREHRSNLLHEMHRLQSLGERILPGLREHITRRNTGRSSAAA